jgi:hypothetical protein
VADESFFNDVHEIYELGERQVSFMIFILFIPLVTLLLPFLLLGVDNIYITARRYK